MTAGPRGSRRAGGRAPRIRTAHGGIFRTVPAASAMAYVGLAGQGLLPQGEAVKRHATGPTWANLGLSK